MITEKTLNSETETTWRGQRLFGLRGCWTPWEGNPSNTRYARIVAGVKQPKRELLVFDIPEKCMPYLPDMSKGSEFDKEGHWHRYSDAERQGYEIVTRGTDKHQRVQRVFMNGQQIYDRDTNEHILSS